jgi:hypothetical protein
MNNRALPSCPVGQFTQGIFGNLVLLTNQETPITKPSKIASNAKIKPVVMFYNKLQGIKWEGEKIA